VIKSQANPVDFLFVAHHPSAMQNGLPFPDISPEIFSISLFGLTIAPKWYAMAYIVGIIIGWRICVIALRRVALWHNNTAPMKTSQMEDLLTWLVVGIIVGGRLGYVFFYKPMEFLADPITIPMIWTGGMSFHGGFIGVVLAVYFYCRKHSIDLGSAANLIALGSPPALLLGRLANFINAELWGRPTEMPWGVIFPGRAAQFCPDLEAGTACARHPSQLYEAGLEGLLLGGLLLLLAFRWNGLKKPWLLAGVFIAGYGLARFLVEFVRQPDAQFVSEGNPIGFIVHLSGYGLTQGQLLSLPMLFVGAWLIRRALR